jgi:TolA-binding protein
MIGARAVVLAALTAILTAGPPAWGADALELGWAALADGLYALAETQCREYLAGDANPAARAEGVDCLMRALQSQQKWDAMAELLEPRSPVAATLAGDGGQTYWRAVLQYEAQAYAQALATVAPLEADAALTRYRGRAIRLAGWCLRQQQDARGAAARFSRYDALTEGRGPAALPNLMDWGAALLADGDHARAAAVFGRLAVADPPSSLATEARYQLGVALLRGGSIAEATNTLTRLAADATVPGDLRGRACLALSEAFRGATNMAARIAWLGQGLACTRNVELKQSLTLALGYALLDAGRVDEGAPLIQSFVSDVPGDARAAPAQMRLADALLGAAKPEAAAAAFQHYLETFGDAGEARSQALAGRGWALFQLERYAEAAEVFLKAFEASRVASQRESCLVKAADARFANRQFQLAQALYMQALTEFPESARRATLLLQVAESSAGRGDVPQAIAQFEALTADPAAGRSAEDAYFRIAGLQAGLGQWEAAREAYERFMRAFPRSGRFAEALFGRGVANYHLWQPETIGDFDQVLERYPSHAVAEQASYMKVMGLYRLGRDAAAMVAAQAFIDRYPQSTLVPRVVFWMARAHYNAGRYAEAERDFLAFAAAYPAHPLADDAVYRAGLSAVHGKAYVRSNEIFAGLFKNYPASPKVPEARFAQADALVQLGKFAEAILIFDEIVNRYPQAELVGAAWGRKGDCQFALAGDDPRRYEECIESYRVVARIPGVRPGVAVQAEYKIGLAYEKLQRPEAALEQYYTRVIVPCVAMLARRETPSESLTVWFTRAVLNAAAILETQQEWRRLVRVLDRLASAGLPISREIENRIEKIKTEHWWFFY